MKYTNDQIQTLLKSPKYKTNLDKGRKYEAEIKLHTEAKNEDELKGNEAFKELCALIQKRLPAKAYNRVKDFIEYPLASVDLLNGVLVELYRVFQSKNAFFSFETDNETKNKEVAEIVKGLDVHNYVIETGKKVFKNQPNLIVVIDKDEEGNPYIVTVGSERVLDAKINLDGTLDYIAFIHSEDEENNKQKLAFYDGEQYAVYVKDTQTKTITFESTVDHKIGYCPARCFVKNPLNSENPYKRQIPISGTIGKVREWLLFNIYKYYNEHYSAFPVVEKMKPKCGNPNCVNGWVILDSYIIDGDSRQPETKKCNDCDNDSIGVGTVITISPKTNPEDDNGAGVFKFIAPEITGSKYLSEKLDSLEKYIELKTIGQNNLITREAVNEQQVKGSFQSRESVLINLKEVLEEIHIWIVETAIKAKYLGGSNIISYANYGTEFYLVDETELQARFEKAKTSGLPDAEVDTIYRQLLTTKYKDNPDEITRMEILRLLDPLPYKTIDDAISYREKGIITEEEFYIKARFLSIIDRFELENGSLVNFGKKLSLSDRVKKIQLILTKYANGDIEAKQTK